MARYISFDGGGTKLNGMMFDEGMNLLGAGHAGGINTTQASLEDCCANMRACLDQMLAGGVPDVVDAVYYTGVGHFKLLCGEVASRTRVTEFIGIGEAQGGLLAGALREEGMLALSGTGSDACYIGPNGRSVVGGWGPILGDDGSGSWIGQQALRAAVRMINGWGEDTLLLGLIREEWKVDDDWKMVPIVHRSAAPFRQVAMLTPLVGRAAAQNDKVALDILREAGHLMALQTKALIRRAGLGPDQLDVTLCGGAWKSHPAMFEAYCGELTAQYPTLTARRPMFEHVCAGPVRFLLDRGVPREEAARLLRRQFPQYRVDMSDDI